MEPIVYFLWMCEETISGLGYMPPVTMGLLTALIISIVINNPFSLIHYHRRNWLAFSPALIPLATLMVGTIFRHHSGDTPYSWAQYLNTALGIMHIPLAFFLLWKLKGIRLFAIMTILFGAWCTYWAWILSAMSIYGDWI